MHILGLHLRPTGPQIWAGKGGKLAIWVFLGKSPGDNEVYLNWETTGTDKDPTLRSTPSPGETGQ